MFSILLTALSYAITIAFISFLIIYCIYKSIYKSYYEMMAKIPGPEPKNFIIGNIDLFRIKGVPLNQCVLKVLVALSQIYEKYGIFRIFLGPQPLVVVFKHQTMEPILTSTTNITKSVQYQFIGDWLGNGLLLSTGSLWKSRRRMLTPAFHFKIIEDFIPIMTEHSDSLVNRLKNKTTKPFIDIRKYITECTLDIISETAMGVSVGAQVGNNKEYTDAIHTVGEVLMKRAFMPLLWPNFIFYRCQMGKQFKSCLNVLHTMTRDVIKQRKSQIMSNKEQSCAKSNESTEENIYLSKSRKRLAFLDLLLEYNITNNSLSLEDIREEVDTFMFEGHDTTSVSLSWTLYLLGLHPEVQILIQEELKLIFGDQRDKEITYEDIQRMEYLECVIKESLRLYPSVPLMGRNLSEDVKCGDYVIPKGTNVFMLIERLHFDPQVFSEPLDFKPQRFQNESTSEINPYSYVPFSAGPRGCIGKRFAITEEKVILAKLFLNFNVKSLDPRDKIQTSAEMVYRAKDPLRLQIISKEDFIH